MRTFLRILLGCTPFVLGYLMDKAILTFPLPLLTVSLIFLGVWALLSFLLCRSRRSAFVSACVVQLPSLLALLLVLYQELVQGYYFMNPLGWLPQLFFLPVLPAASKICYSVPQLAGTVTDLRVWPAFIVGFFLMLVVSWAGGKLKPKREK